MIQFLRRGFLRKNGLLWCFWQNLSTILILRYDIDRNSNAANVFFSFVSVSVQMVFGSSTALSAYVFQIECGRYRNVMSPGIFSSPTNMPRRWHGNGTRKEHLINETHFFSVGSTALGPFKAQRHRWPMIFTKANHCFSLGFRFGLCYEIRGTHRWNMNILCNAE